MLFPDFFGSKTQPNRKLRGGSLNVVVVPLVVYDSGGVFGERRRVMKPEKEEEIMVVSVGIKRQCLPKEGNHSNYFNGASDFLSWEDFLFFFLSFGTQLKEESLYLNILPPRLQSSADLYLPRLTTKRNWASPNFARPIDTQTKTKQ